MSLEGNQTIRKVTRTSEEWTSQKAMSRRVTSKKLIHMKKLTLKVSSVRFMDWFVKVNPDKTRSERSTDKSKKFVNHQWLSFLLWWYFYLLRKKVTFSFSSLKPVDQKALGSRSKVSFWSLYKLEDNEEETKNSRHLNIYQAFILLNLLNLENYLL